MRELRVIKSRKQHEVSEARGRSRQKGKVQDKEHKQDLEVQMRQCDKLASVGRQEESRQEETAG